MNFAILLALLSTATFGVKSFACSGIAGCTGGLTETADGHVRVKDFTPSNDGGNLVSISTSDAHGIYKLDDSDWYVVPLSDGSMYYFRDILSLEVHDLRDFEPSGYMNYLPYNGTSSSYTYYVREDHFLNNNTSDSVVPRPIYSGQPCVGSCKKMIGNIDGVAQLEDGISVNGWVCDRGDNRSLNVKVFLGGPRGSRKGTLVATGTANLKRSDKVLINNFCSTSSNYGHRFRVKIPQSIVNRHRFEKIYVHGMSVYPENQILGSGKMSVPTVRVKGRIAEAKLAGNMVHLIGWACNEGVEKSVQVRVFAGGPAGIGTALKSEMANETSGDYVANACGTTLRKHRFDVAIRKADFDRAKGKVWVHGISLLDGPNNALHGSGERLSY
jgi:hypothetical protein